MNLNENRDDAVEMESSEENINTAQIIQQMITSKAAFDDTWKMFDNFAALISDDKKQSYTNLKETFANFIKYAEELYQISGSVNESFEKIKYVEILLKILIEIMKKF